MARKHLPYAAEFRRQMIELVRAGRRPEELAKEFEPSAQAIRNWVTQADRDEGRRADGLTTDGGPRAEPQGHDVSSPYCRVHSLCSEGRRGGNRAGSPPAVFESGASRQFQLQFVLAYNFC